MKNKVTVYAQDYLNLVADGALANKKTADGRLIPVIILDTSLNKALSNLVTLHKTLPMGDATSIWCVKKFSKKEVTLLLKFTKPVELHVAIKFDACKHYTVIDGIIHSRGVYIQPGKPGDKLSDNINAPKILVEIPARTTFPDWENILFKYVNKRLKKGGVGRKDIKAATLEFISTSRDVWGKRMN